MRIGRWTLLVLSLPCWSILYSPAAACDLAALSAAPAPATIILDEQPQNLEVARQFRFESKDDAVTVFRETSFTFDDFTAVYANFINARATPRNTCDVIKTGDFETAIDASGLAMGRFQIYYEDNLCFMLRFFESMPGVRKDPMHQRLAQGTLEVQNAFQPGLREGTLFVEMATLYSGPDGPRLEKIYDRPLAGFLMEESFLHLVGRGIVGEDRPEDIADFSLNGASFIEQNGKVRLSISLKKSMPLPDACKFHEEKMASGLWAATPLTAVTAPAGAAAEKNAADQAQSRP